MPVATTATPSATCTTSVTPLIALVALASNEISLAPNAGGRSMTAVSKPGSFTSIVYVALPVHLASESTRRVCCLPISLNCDGSFNATFCGTGCCAAATAISPNVARCAPLLSTPLLTPMLEAGTFQRCAAAETSIERAVAPAWRICSKLLAIAVDPPVP